MRRRLRTGAPAPAAADSGGDQLLYGAAALALFACGGLLLYGSGRGLDLTDEIFYLIWARDPNAYALTYQPFGYLLHPLFALAGGDLQTYRVAGFAIAAGAGAFLGQAMGAAADRRALMAVYGAAAALTIFFPWIITPSYNSAANVGALLMIAGGLKALQPAPRAPIASALAGGAGLCIAAFSKPPLFVIALVAMLTAAIAARRARVPLSAAIGLGAALALLLVPPAQLMALVTRIIASQHVLSLPNTPLQLPAKVLTELLIVPRALLAGSAAAGLGFVLGRAPWSRWLGYLAVALSVIYLGSVATAAADRHVPDFLGLALVTAATGYAGVVRSEQNVNSALVGLLLVAPAAVALGTFNNEWFQLNFSMAFPLLALFHVAAADRTRWRGGVARGVAIAAPVAILLLAAWAPYSLPAPIFRQQVPIEAPFAGGVLRVDPQTAGFVRGARGLAQGSPLVDLSGTGPGVSVVLGADAPVLPWLNPATPTWPDVVWSRLTPEARERASFVVPVWPAFAGSQPAKWLAAHERRFRRTRLPPMTFWGQTRALELWRPYTIAGPREPPAT